MAENQVLAEQAKCPAAAPGRGLAPTRRQKIRLVGLVVMKRVRFVAVLAAVGLFIGYWDTVMNYWDKWTHTHAVAPHGLESGHEFYCPMDPQVVRSTYEPNGDVPKCPICGMPLSVRLKGQAAKLPAGITGRVQLSPERVQLAGIQTVPVAYRPVARQTRTVGYVTYDESRLSRIVSRVDGYVEKLFVNETFAVVQKGDPLAEIYSPELYSTAREFLLARQSGMAADMASAARDKLLLLGVSQPEIDALASSGQASPRMVIRSPQNGYVVEKRIVVGASVETRMTLFEVADLSSVWVEAEVYEKDIPFLQAGQAVEASVEALSHGPFQGKLALVYPRVEAATRTNRIRVKLDNPGHALRPGMFATVRIDTPLESVEPYRELAARSGRALLASATAGTPAPPAEFLVVPERAVVDTGSRKVVYVERQPGLFEGVEVELGPRQDDHYPVLKGLKEGDRVAAAGGFLIDAETRLNPAAANTYFGSSAGPQSAGRQAAPAPTVPAPAEKSPAAPSPGASPEGSGAPVVLGEEELRNIRQLPEADQKLALAQKLCPVTGGLLGSMGVPAMTVLHGQTIFVCCKGCIGEARRSPEETLKKISAPPR